ncbi:hypothetical protein GGTG_13513 [Gaeumannomyces tritici R3-111a-1]|uniref:Uncharacterized protein n=1 Tax=Gaeumannomyces tritici (strain R3-111a-1) TaxID=644352 RepID=J3PJ30_GAET3|nr:hypothetical protein GGTG_13513 [Gaeumannomyces tritici R3-111a-1]EJT68921.1 hypothetical protein GGTG_13513 [Gaeumannomyces tritici R3-111a-1]
MSRQPTFSSIIHLRDFVDTVTDDSIRDAPNHVEIRADINIFDEDDFDSPDVVAEPIRTRIHVYMTRGERDLYLPNIFFYADGRFSTVLSADGDAADFDEYRRHLPEQWCPMVTVIGSVRASDDSCPEPSGPRHFTVETSVYDASKAAPVQFAVTCFLENTRRWQKVKTPPSGAFLSVTAKVAGRTAHTNRLALRVLDLTYLPRPPSAAPASTPTPTRSSKRSTRWEGRAGPSTPSKRPRVSDPANEPANPSDSDATPPEIAQTGHDLPHTENSPDSASVPAPPPTAARPGDSPLSPARPLTSESGPRPHRSRHLPKKYADLEQTAVNRTES